ncbi:ShlB/FhaC/HecB family hemolysin secretion/activation protein [Polaribacter aquimarinus]|uniref:ShlB/FhaC/HecB family hemolysin secretion/activation protein n=1 Tax=Polaribacter aquimarinus TaxID=2100726 RepID=UPI0011B1EBD3|nr:ShlB/FhaC/HecB family hemolysin secretion/activation protein [Polaribacter aquimarinus]
MKRNFIHYIYLVLLVINSIKVFSQEITLKINSKIDSEKKVLDDLIFIKKHKDFSSINSELQKISWYLKVNGYFTNTIDSITTKNNSTTAFFSLNHKTERAVLYISDDNKVYFKNHNLKNNFITVPISNLASILNETSKKLDNEGKSFSKVSLENISIKKNTLFAVLKIDQSKKRVISKVIIKDYETFPQSYLKNYFTIYKNTIFNQKKIKEISLLSRDLEFAKEIKPPEVLFKNDSTFLFLYLKKQQNNSFDGIINFASKENGGVLFNGNLDLKLNNILNTGEVFNLFWNSIGEEKQEFKISSITPYIFNSKFSPEISFSIYKQDSTFLNTKFNSKLFYNINQKTKLALTYNSETSENLEETLSNNIESFNNYFLGFQLEYNIPKNDFFFNDKFNLNLNPSIGKRKTKTKSSKQFKIETSASYIWDLNTRNSFYIRNKTGFLNSDSLIDNELFRIGGTNSIRGFNEQSIFTNSYSYFNLEYRYLTSKNSFLYSISDIGKVIVNNKSKTLYGLGLGYMFNINNSRVNLGSVLGGNSIKELDINNLQLILSWKSFF